VTYQIDQEKHRIHTRCIGPVIFDEVFRTVDEGTMWLELAPAAR
jgi:hypothetical protein